MKVFIDTSAFIALFIKNEADHKKATKKYEGYRKNRAVLFTSDFVLDELYTRLAYITNPSFCVSTVSAMEKGISENRLQLITVDKIIRRDTVKLFIKYAEHALSFTDASTAVIYKHFRMDEVFTLDKDFKKVHLKTSF